MMRMQSALQHVVRVLLVVASVACGDSGAPSAPADPVRIPATDIVGTYMLTSYNGQSVPALRTPSAANDFRQDTIFAGCLELRTLADTALVEGGTVNVTWMFNTEAASRYLANPAQCPPFLPAAYQSYVWDGSHGTWSFCGTHLCSRTDFTAAVIDGTIVISARDSAHAATYVKQ